MFVCCACVYLDEGIIMKEWMPLLKWKMEILYEWYWEIHKKWFILDHHIMESVLTTLLYHNQKKACPNFTQSWNIWLVHYIFITYNEKYLQTSVQHNLSTKNMILRNFCHTSWVSLIFLHLSMLLDLWKTIHFFL